MSAPSDFVRATAAAAALNASLSAAPAPVPAADGVSTSASTALPADADAVASVFLSHSMNAADAALQLQLPAGATMMSAIEAAVSLPPAAAAALGPVAPPITPPQPVEQWASGVVAFSSQFSASDNAAVRALGLLSMPRPPASLFSCHFAARAGAIAWAVARLPGWWLQPAGRLVLMISLERPLTHLNCIATL